jgi:hypothetical protein
LAADVVDVEVAVNCVSAGFEETGKGVAEDWVSGGCDSYWVKGVGARVFHYDFQWAFGLD